MKTRRAPTPATDDSASENTVTNGSAAATSRSGSEPRRTRAAAGAVPAGTATKSMPHAQQEKPAWSQWLVRRRGTGDVAATASQQRRNSDAVWGTGQFRASSDACCALLCVLHAVMSWACPSHGELAIGSRAGSPSCAARARDRLPLRSLVCKMEENLHLALTHARMRIPCPSEHGAVSKPRPPTARVVLSWR